MRVETYIEVDFDDSADPPILQIMVDHLLLQLGCLVFKLGKN